MSDGPIKVAILYDLKAWILGHIARSLKRHAERPGVLEFVPLRAPRERRELIPLVRAFDVIHYLSPGDFYRLGVATPAPTVVTIHHVATRINKRFNQLARNVDVICPINEECEQLTAQLPGVAGIPMIRTSFGIDTEFFQPHPEGRRALIERIGCPADTILLGFAAKKNSNEDERKGLDRYWAILERLKEKFGPEGVKLVVFGPGAESPIGWRPEDAPEPVRSMVWFTGFLPEEDMPVLYSGLDFYLCLSRIEGGPYPVMETMGCGVRPISTRVGIVGELVDEGRTGFIVSEADYLDRIPQILADHPLDGEEARGMSEAARQTILDRRQWKNVATPELYEQVYRLALERYSRRSLSDRLSRRVRLSLSRLSSGRKREKSEDAD